MEKALEELTDFFQHLPWIGAIIIALSAAVLKKFSGFLRTKEAEAPSSPPKQEAEEEISREERVSMQDIYEERRVEAKSHSGLNRTKPILSEDTEKRGQNRSGLQLPSDDTVRGMIWAEILGPPKAKQQAGRARARMHRRKG